MLINRVIIQLVILKDKKYHIILHNIFSYIIMLKIKETYIPQENETYHTINLITN